MLAARSRTLPDGPGWQFEAKLDGFRCIADVPQAGGPRLYSRTGRDISLLFPEVVQALTAITGEALLDAELVVFTSRRVDFGAVARRGSKNAARLADEHPASLYVFDLLRRRGLDLMRRPLSDRRMLLEQVLRAAGHPQLVPSLVTTDRAEAQTWLDGMQLAEGIVAKRSDSIYEPGYRGWVKVKAPRARDYQG